MRTLRSLFALGFIATTRLATAAVITVNTTNNIDPIPVVETSLLQAMQMLQEGDTIAFNIPNLPLMSDVHYIPTPPGGYPKITQNNVTIDGYTQASSSPNSNPILAANNAQIKIVVDSRNGQFTDGTYEPANSRSGFLLEGVMLCIFNATNVHIRGLSLLGIKAGPDTTNSAGMQFDETCAIGVERNYSGGAVGLGNGLHISGCWIGVDPDGVTVSGCDNGPRAERHRDDAIGNASRLPANNAVIGVKPGSSNPRAEFNVIVGHTEDVLLEGQGHRVSGNFLGVLPDGVHDYIVPFAELGVFAESHIEIGRGASDVVIGTDGDGTNDADERNVMGGVVTDGHAGSFNLNGYTHVVELYSLSSSPGPDRTRVRIAGNYVGVGIDGTTRFTNGVPAFNGSATTGSQYWIGSDLDGVSDAVEANVIYNNYPPGLYYETAYTNSPAGGNGSQGFLDQPDQNALYALRGNVLANNYPFPVNPGVNNGSFVTNYVNKALATPQASYNALLPVLSPSSTTARLIGTVPAANGTFPWTIIDLYLPDPDGLVNGLVVPDPNLPNGWVQGSNYLASFVLGSSADHDSSSEGFAFDICSLGLAPGTKVTVSANYSMDPPGTHNARILTSLFSAPLVLPKGIAITSITRAGQTLTITWCGGTAPYQLQKKIHLEDATWLDVGAPTASFSANDTTAVNDTGFYRVKGN